MFTLLVTEMYKKKTKLPTYFNCSSKFNIKYVLRLNIDKGYLWLNDKKELEKKTHISEVCE